VVFWCFCSFQPFPKSITLLFMPLNGPMSMLALDRLYRERRLHLWIASRSHRTYLTRSQRRNIFLYTQMYSFLEYDPPVLTKGILSLTSHFAHSLVDDASCATFTSFSSYPFICYIPLFQRRRSLYTLLRIPLVQASGRAYFLCGKLLDG